MTTSPFLPRIGPIARLSLGLVALLMSLIMLADTFLQAIPDPKAAERQVHQRIAENIALQMISLLESEDHVTMGKTLQRILSRDTSILSITVNRPDGTVLMHRGQSSANASKDPWFFSTQPITDQLRIPVMSGQESWGDIHIQFAKTSHTSILAWLTQPSMQMLAAIALGGFLLFYAYLRRAMHYLNPSASVPDRVRKAFDSLAEGLLIVDQNARIVLANNAFRQLHPEADIDLNGQKLDALTWLNQSHAGAAAAPWTKTLQSGEAVTAEPLTLLQPEGDATQLLVSCAAIADNRGKARGCLITFDNVTAVHRANEELRHTLAQLEISRERIEEQNNELRRLASRDSLTGCFNRRAFFELATELFSTAQRNQKPLCCMMIDIDHFKQFNDTYGHAVGDQVIDVVARSLSAGLRQGDVLGRYGGEEFCIVLPGATPHDALAVAERMRADLEANANQAIRGIQVTPITASFGVATLSASGRTIEVVIDQADQALYRSKQAGRNRVTLWSHSEPLKLVSSSSAPSES